MSFAATHQKLADLIDRELSGLDLSGEPACIYDPVRYMLDLGGKRIRPFFVLNACGICQGSVKEAVPAAVAIELLHNFTLIHDDIMDMAETRRGKPSVYKKWNSSTAILAGDVAFAKALEQLQYYGTSENYTKSQYASILDIFLDSTVTVCEGQGYDLEFAERNNVNTENYLNMIRDKTAALLSGSLMLGGAVADADPDKLELLRDLGETAGIAFQIQDDLLDVMGDPGKFGKKRGGDIVEGKKTYLSILALQRGDKDQKSILNSILSGREVSTRQIDQIIDIYTTLGIIDETETKIESYYSKSESLLDKFEESVYKTNLLDLFNQLKNREF